MNSFSEKVSGIVDDIELQKTYDKTIIKHRFLDEISYYELKRDNTKKYYNAFRFTVTTGSILLPAILSMGQMDPEKLPKSFDMISYWASWSISLMVTASNGFLQLFSLDKNYFSYAMVVEQLKTEGWQFFGLSGKYEDFENHQQAYKTFSKAIESIKRKQIDQEFSNGKGENKKKKFDFHGEMKKFSENQQLLQPPVQQLQSSIPSVQGTIQQLQSSIQEPIQPPVQETIKKEIKEKLNEKSENIKSSEIKLNETLNELKKDEKKDEEKK